MMTESEEDQKSQTSGGGDKPETDDVKENPFEAAFEADFGDDEEQLMSLIDVVDKDQKLKYNNNNGDDDDDDDLKKYPIFDSSGNGPPTFVQRYGWVIYAWLFGIIVLPSLAFILYSKHSSSSSGSPILGGGSNVVEPNHDYYHHQEHDNHGVHDDHSSNPDASQPQPQQDNSHQQEPEPPQEKHDQGNGAPAEPKPADNPDSGEQNGSQEGKQTQQPDQQDPATSETPEPSDGAPPDEGDTQPEQQPPQDDTAGGNNDNYPHFDCPPYFMLSEDSDEDKFYLLPKDEVGDVNEFLETYQDGIFDQDADVSYEEYRDEMYDWKAKRFGDNLKDGDTLYESASGLGLNLVLTLEILHQAKGLSNLVVYGNDYVFNSAHTSNMLMERGILPYGGTKGNDICQGDSGNLSWVPSDSFDLVFTGFVPPLQDPLEYEFEEDDLWRTYKRICHRNNKNQIKLTDQMKQMQEDWYGVFVGEMIRIAKPGVPVIVEQVTPSVCTYWDDWGGVDKDFWGRAIETYQWDIDPFSIEMEDDDSGNHDGRYHVFMRKNAKQP